MKFNLFAISAIALCLLQQTQAITQSKTQTQIYNGDASTITQEKTIAPKVDRHQTKGHGLSQTLNHITTTSGGILKRRDGLGNLLDLSILKLDVVQSLVGDLVNTVDDLLNDKNLLKSVGKVLGNVLNLVETVLKQVLHLLCDDGILKKLDIDELNLPELLEKITKLKLLNDLDVLNDDTVLNVKEIEGLLKSVTDILDGLDGNIANGLVKNILETVADILNQLLGATSKIPLGKVTGTKRGILHRETVKRNIARRAAI